MKEQVVEVRRALREPADAEGWGPSSLTTAEIRVLQYLPTHLTLVEIADRLFVSRNTIKTQAISIYRKLGASSRGSAVDIAREAGLLDHDLLLAEHHPHWMMPPPGVVRTVEAFLLRGVG